MGEVHGKIKLIFRFLCILRSEVRKTPFDLQYALLLLHVEMFTDVYTVNQ